MAAVNMAVQNATETTCTTQTEPGTWSLKPSTDPNSITGWVQWHFTGAGKGKVVVKTPKGQVTVKDIESCTRVFVAGADTVIAGTGTVES